VEEDEDPNDGDDKVDEDPNDDDEEENVDPNEEEDWGPVYPAVAEMLGDPPTVLEEGKDCCAPL